MRSWMRRWRCCGRAVFGCQRPQRRKKAGLLNAADLFVVSEHGRAEGRAPRARPSRCTHSACQDSLRAHEGNDTRYSSYGMGFVKFAAEEKQLFRWLYLEGGQMEPYQNDILLPEVLRAMEDEFGYPEEVARRFHQDMIYYSYGLAILANTDHLHLTESELREAFRREFRALIAIHGKPAKLPEFAVKAGVVL